MARHITSKCREITSEREQERERSKNFINITGVLTIVEVCSGRTTMEFYTAVNTNLTSTDTKGYERKKNDDWSASGINRVAEHMRFTCVKRARGINGGTEQRRSKMLNVQQRAW